MGQDTIGTATSVQVAILATLLPAQSIPLSGTFLHEMITSWMEGC